MKLNRLFSILVSILMVLVVFLNCGKKEEAADEAAGNPGQELYLQNCSSCHGETGAGDGPAAASLNPKPRDLMSAAKDWKNGATAEGINKTLQEGISGTGMVAYKHLGDESLKQITDYVMSLRK